MNRYLLGKQRSRNRRKGFTLMETLLVVGIVVILCSIIFIGVAALLKNMRFKQVNDYAKTIFMAAQSNLTAMRNSGELAELEGKGKILPENTGFPLTEEGADQYVYTSSSTGFSDYDLVLPVNSVETHIRGRQVIVEYNPVTGNVYAVFYCENAKVDILSLYRNGNLSRDENDRRGPEVGYHQGSILSQDEVEELNFAVNLEYKNDQEGYVLLTIEEPDKPAASFKNNLEVKLTIKGKISGKTRIVTLMSNKNGKREDEQSSGNTVKLTYILDSLADGLSFVNLSAQDESKGLGEFANEKAFTFLPGEQVTIEAEVAYKGMPLADEAWASAQSLTVNPMFAELSSSGLIVANGRNLQNLNALSPSLATTVEKIQITRDIDWNATVEYYNEEYGKGGTYTNRSAEAPGRALPYFVPVHNAPLMGTANVNGVDVTFHSLNRNPVIHGNGKKVMGLNIDSTKYSAPSSKEYYVSATTSQIVHYSLTGLFAYVNSEVSDLTIVNSKIKGLDFASSTGTCATGSLAGVAGYKAFFKNCTVYMERNTLEDYGATTGPEAYSAAGTMKWYGVSGEGCVGGLVGYSKSQRLADGYIYTLEHIESIGKDDYIAKTINENEVTFYKCFSAVPVSGNMRGSGSTNYGYVNGVGGLVGLTRISNFYGCYASGKVMATGVYTTSLSTKWSILNLNGKKSMGAGGLVGTSQGSMYWNCFATGDVEANQASGAGSFLGVMVYNAKYTTSSVDYTHLSLMEDCYTTGKVNGSNGSAFVGGNASIDLTSKIQSTDKIYTDFYQMIAPYYYEARKVADDQNRDLETKIMAPTSPADYKSGSVTYYYIAKDCYYLDPDRTDEQVDPDRTNIATGICYDILMDMVNSFSPSKWVDKQWENILTWTTDDGTTFETAYYNIKIFQYYETFTALKNFYDLELRAAFDDSWRDSDLFEGETYSFINPGADYSFAMIDGLDYHGEWPTMSLVLNGGASGLAYWEWYADADGEFDRIYAQFDRADTGDLLSNNELREMGAWVVADGYAVVAPNNTQTVNVKVGTAAAVPLNKTYAKPWTYNGQTVYLYPLTHQVLNNSANRLTSAEDFYVQVTITVGTTKYTAFYNPYCANSQVNPVMLNRDDWSVPLRPASAPAQLEIRTARQLVGLMQAHSKNQLAEGYNYLQTLDIDASKWVGSTKVYSSGNTGDISRLTKPLTNSNGIGSQNANGSTVRKFSGTYTGVGTGNDRPIIANFFDRKTLGLFMHIGDTGAVSNLILKQDGDKTWDCSTKTNGGAGVLADVNEGVIRNVDVVISGTVTLKAKVNAGLLVGKSTGKIENCNVSATAVTLSVADASGSAGGMVGDLAGPVLGGSVNITTSLTATAKNVGGLAGLATGAAVQNVTVNVQSLTYPAAGTYVGGLVGYITGGNYTNVNVTVSGTSKAHGGLASLVDNGANIKNTNVTIEGTMTAENVGGLASTASGITVTDCTVTVKGTMTGSTAAAGLVATYNVTSGYSCSASTVVVEAGGSIAGPASAGFVKELTVAKEDAFKECKVQLNGGTISGYSTAGFAASINGVVRDCAVVGTGTITGNTNAVGFVVTLTSGSVVNSRVTPALAQTAEGYQGVSNTNLEINGATSAGFVKTVSSGAKVLKCDVLCEVAGNAPSGFATTNNGEINGCMANVAITKGSAFVGENSSTGVVSNCYGWYGDGSTNTTAVAVPGATVGKYYSSYFADIDIPSDQARTKQAVTLFDNKGICSKMTLNDLTTAYSKLATTNNNQWSQPGKFSAYSNGIVVGYCYPMLREHCGNWAIPSVNVIELASYEGEFLTYAVDTLFDGLTEPVYVTQELTDAIRKECIIL